MDLRKGFDGLAGIVRNEFNLSPFADGIFIFFNRRRDLVKLLHWEGDGFAIYYKRLEKGTFEMPMQANQHSVSSLSITAQQLQFILAGIHLSSVKKRKRFQREIVNTLV